MSVWLPAGESNAPDRSSRAWSFRARAGFVVACLLAMAIGARGITNEGYVSLQGDMPRYLMNGVYLLDVLRDRPFNGLDTFLEYSQLYYARYPALSLGHHPPLVAAAEVPMYALFGVSVRSARLVCLFSFVAAVAFLYLLVVDLYGPLIALFASVLFATNRWVVVLAQSVLSEMPTVALVIASAYFLHRFCVTQQRRALVALVAATVLSVYAKQLAVFVFPAFFLAAVSRLGVKRLLQRDVLIAASAIVVLILPLVPLTLIMSPGNVAATVGAFNEPGIGATEIVWTALRAQFNIPILLLAAAGLVQAAFARDRRSLLFVFWMGSVLAGILLAGRFEPARYSIYWVPACCTLAASVAAIRWHSRVQTGLIVAALVLAAGVQMRAAGATELPSATGYEEAATFVLQSNPGATVLFSGDVDTGYFTFFIRKHDIDRKLVVLRSDKVLTTSSLQNVAVEDRIEAPDEIYPILRRFGTRYVVVEDQPSVSRVLEWLRQELHSGQFAERRRIPIGTSDPRLRGTDLVVYEFLDASSPAEDAVLDMRLPLVAQSVSVKLADLLRGKYLR